MSNWFPPAGWLGSIKELLVWLLKEFSPLDEDDWDEDWSSCVPPEAKFSCRFFMLDNFREVELVEI